MRPHDLRPREPQTCKSDQAPVDQVGPTVLVVHDPGKHHQDDEQRAPQMAGLVAADESCLPHVEIAEAGEGEAGVATWCAAQAVVERVDVGLRAVAQAEAVVLPRDHRLAPGYEIRSGVGYDELEKAGQCAVQRKRSTQRKQTGVPEAEYRVHLLGVGLFVFLQHLSAIHAVAGDGKQRDTGGDEKATAVAHQFVRLERFGNCGVQSTELDVVRFGLDAKLHHCECHTAEQTQQVVHGERTRILEECVPLHFLCRLFLGVCGSARHGVDLFRRLLLILLPTL